MLFRILLDILWDLDRGCLEVCVILNANPSLMNDSSEEIIVLIRSSSEMSISTVRALPSTRTTRFFAAFMNAFPGRVSTRVSTIQIQPVQNMKYYREQDREVLARGLQIKFLYGIIL